MVAKSTQMDRAISLHQDHARLQDLLESVRETILDRQANAAIVAQTLDELIQALLEHFQEEEEGGYFAKAIEMAPRLSQRASQLLSEHPELAAQLIAVHGHAKRHNGSERWWLELNDMYKRFLHRFSDHEEKEDLLLRDATNDVSSDA